MSNIIVLDLSKPRKMVANKFDEIIFDYKMKGYKQLTTTDKLLITIGIGIVVTILTPNMVVYAKDLAFDLSDKEVVGLFKQHMQDLHYTNEFIDRLLKTYDVNEMRDILNTSIQTEQLATVNESWFVKFLKLEWNGLKILDDKFVSGIENLAHSTRGINPFIR